MRYAYVIIGELEDTDYIDTFYAICHTEARAEELCREATKKNPGRIYHFRKVVEDDN